MKPIIVQKFGGSSLAEIRQIQQAARIVGRARVDGFAPVVCVSARGDTTDRLTAEALLFGSVGAVGARELDQLLATGEVASAACMALALNSQQIPAVSLAGHQAGIAAAPSGGESRIASIDTDRMARLVEAGTVVVVAGFQGVDALGDTRTLGRGGSDTTAVALAAALGAHVCEIYTDVAGVYTADPRTVPGATVLPEIPPQVMGEMAISGARVLHARAVELAAVHHITLTVGTPASRVPGTVIPGRSTTMLEGSGFVVAVTHDSPIIRVLVRNEGRAHGLGRLLVDLLSEHRIPLDFMAWSGEAADGASAGFVVRADREDDIRAAMLEASRKHGFSYALDAGMGRVSLVGVGLLNRPDYTARALRALSDLGTDAEWVATTQSRTSVLVPEPHVGEAAAALHEEFALGKPHPAPLDDRPLTTTVQSREEESDR
ncbi:aspartate kinase [Streptomonospora algeriensis]|uniref:Aspartokinase n=1 Tax=Streptomonospora algeriensis TaxID=995084 RepID=A0ABW3BDQ8_9ACTN